MITKTLFGIYRGREVYLYTLSDEKLKVGIIDLGAAIQFIKVATPNGERDVCLGFDRVDEYLQSGMYCGAAIGRVANRIAGAEFRLNGELFRLTPNEGKNHLHGGANGFDKHIFAVHEEGEEIVFSRYSRDGEEGYPGNLFFRAAFSLDGGALDIRYTAKCDCDTLWAPTCHAYFNLNGGDIGGTLLKINADKYTPIDGELIPVGTLESVSGTPFDFTTPKEIGKDIGVRCGQLSLAGGYDHNFALNGSHAATAVCKDSGVQLDVYTDMPGLQFYSGNFIRGTGKNGRLSPRDGFCLEPQYFPNAINTEGFESPVLQKNTERQQYIRYVFSCV